MNKASFLESLNQGRKLLKTIELFQINGIKPVGEVSQEFKSASIKDKYIKAYEVAKRNFDFDIFLKDESFFQFSYQNDGLPKLRYAFFQNPQENVSYSDYLNKIVNTTYEEVGELFMEEYSQYLNELEINTSAASIRYDLDYPSHKTLIHPASHIHIGNSEDIRLPLNKIMTPFSFILFIIKNIYFGFWKYLIEEDPHFDKEYFSLMKNQCPVLEKGYWDVQSETKGFFLT